MKIKKKSLLMASACLPLAMMAQKTEAGNRVQYSAQDANALATEGNTNTMSFTFSHAGRKGEVLTAKDAYSADEKNHGGAAAATGGLWGTGEKPDWWDNYTNPDGSMLWEDAADDYCMDGCSSRKSDGAKACYSMCSSHPEYFTNRDTEEIPADNGDNSPLGTFYHNPNSEMHLKSSISNGQCSCTSYQCYPAGTQITLADGSAKSVEDITYDDDLLVWDFDEGKFASAKPIWIKTPQMTKEYNYLRFSDGSVLKTINEQGTKGHRIFNQEAGKFTYPMTDETPLGTHTLNAKGELITLVEKREIVESTELYNIITERHLNCFAGNVLTSCRLNNMYPIKDLKFVKDNRKIVPYEEFAELDRKWYDGLRLGEQQGEINKDGSVNHGDKSLVDYVKRIIKVMAEDNESSYSTAA